MNRHGKPQRIAIFGATSDIAVVTARIWARRGCRLVLVARNEAALEDVAEDLGALGAKVAHFVWDFRSVDGLDGLVSRAWSCFDGLDAAFIAYGVWPDQARTEQDPVAFQEAIMVNFTSPAILANALAGRFAAQRFGTIAVITSVAGDRGRASNYAYGAAKGGLQRLLEGVRHRLHGTSVQVLDIRSGLVSTKMTAHRPQNRLIFARRERVAASIVTAIDRRQAVLYTPGFWRFLMWVVRSLPDVLFHRTKF
jgi:decaprenylphospho-beta-D-erythro-pentofuranosid-2-ulose 2-reductase